MVNTESDGSGRVFSIPTILLLKNILTNSFKFLIFTWKFFAIFLVFIILKVSYLIRIIKKIIGIWADKQGIKLGQKIRKQKEQFKVMG